MDQPRRLPPALRQRWLRDGRTLAFLSMPFALAAGLLALLSAGEDGDYWHAMDLALYTVAALAAWAAAAAAFLLWTVIRDDLQVSSLPAIGILTGLMVAGAVWETGMYDRAARCHAEEGFYAGLAALPHGERQAAIAAAAPLLQAPSICGGEALALWFGGDPLVAPGTEPPTPQARQEVLAALLAQGLPADDRLLYRFALVERDAAATRLLAERRAALGHSFPVELVETQLLPAAQPCRPDVTGGESLQARAVLRGLLAGMPDGTAGLSDGTRHALACLGARQNSLPIANGQPAR